MKGTKRFGLSDSNSDINESTFRSKRIMIGSSFDSFRAEPSQQQINATPPLDEQRAESSRQHVRALNTQFTSWVQTQLQNHPDELWVDGAQDYLDHASNIMEKFSDVVKWLKANAGRGNTLSAPGYHLTEKLALGSLTTEKKLVPEIKNSEISLFQEKGVFAPSSLSFSASWSSKPSSSQTPVLFGGSQTSVPINQDASDYVDGENELEQPSSPSVKKTEESGIVVVHEVKCKLYVKSSDPADKDAWKDKGTGNLSIKCIEGISKGTKESRPTIVVRNDVGKLLLNALLYPGIKTNLQKNSIVAIFHTSDDSGNNDSVVARTFLIRTKTEEDRNKLATAIQENAPAG